MLFFFAFTLSDYTIVNIRFEISRVFFIVLFCEKKVKKMKKIVRKRPKMLEIFIIVTINYQLFILFFVFFKTFFEQYMAK